MSRGWLF